MTGTQHSYRMRLLRQYAMEGAEYIMASEVS